MSRDLRIRARLPFTRAFADAVNRVVLRGRGDAIVLLHRPGHLNSQTRNKIRILAISVFDSSPALVARNIERRRVHIRVAECPRWGRIEDTYGEDPYLVSRLGVE